MNEKEYCVTCNEEQEEWYVVRRWKQAGAQRREVLPGSYSTAEDATEAMVAMFEANR